MQERPYTFALGQATPSDPSVALMERFDTHLTRTLSALRGQFADGEAYEQALAEGDAPLYDVYELRRPAVAGELLHGLSVLHPGKVGEEYYMTKGHYHAELATAEVYYCLRGQGVMVMETPEGEWAVEPLTPGTVLYVPPRWAHRSVNTGAAEDLATFFVYPGNAGHDYGTIEQEGFRKLVVERDGRPTVIDNPRWHGDTSPGAPSNGIF